MRTRRTIVPRMVAAGVLAVAAVVALFVADLATAIALALLAVTVAGAAALVGPGDIRGPWSLALASGAMWSVILLIRGTYGGREASIAAVLIALHVLAALLLVAGVVAFALRTSDRDPIVLLDVLVIVSVLAMVGYIGVAHWSMSADSSRPESVGIAAIGVAVALSGAVVYLAMATARRTLGSILLGSAVVVALLVAVMIIVLLVDPSPGPVPTLVAAPMLLAQALLAAGAWLDPRPVVFPVAQKGIAPWRVASVAVFAALLPAPLLLDVGSRSQPEIAAVFVTSLVVLSLMTTRSMRMVHRLKAQAALLADLAETDPVTGLGNRRRLLQEISHELDRPGSSGAVVLIDVSRFTELRDSLGPRTSDELLRELAARLKASVASDARVVRLGSAVFGLLLPRIKVSEHAEGMTRALLAVCTGPVVMDSITLQVEVYAGVALLREDGADPEELLNHADVALATAAKRPGRLARYGGDASVADGAALLESELHRALDDGEIVVYFQPQVAMITGGVTQLEALARWEHPVHGLMPPGAFVPAAERTGLIVRLTRQVLDQSLLHCAKWRAEGFELGVAVNLSVHDLLDPGLVETVREALERHHVPARMLELEVTETMSMVDPRRATATMLALAELGVSLAVDDFGTGYSSLAYLRTMPVSRLKIDRSFVSELVSDTSSQAIVASVVEMAHRLRLTVVAEGVEDEMAFGMLVAMGCDSAQGFVLSRPVPAALVPETVRALGRRAVSATPARGLPRLSSGERR